MDVALEKAITGFRLSNEAKGLSRKTTTWYHRNLLLFHKWLEKDIGHPPRIEEVATDQVRRYFTGLRTTVTAYDGHPYHPEEKRPLSPSTICGYYTSLSSFFNWTVREELLTSSPMKNVPRPRVPKFMPDPFSEAEIRALLTACKELPETSALRATAIILVLLDTGIRLNELLGMRLPNLDLEAGRAKIFGKGAKERFVYFGKSTKRALWRYMSLARAEPLLGAENVFLSEDGRPITQRYLAHILAKVSKWGSVQKVHPHRFRRTAAIQFLRNGGNIFALQKLLGHETLDMVQHYVDLASDDVATAHKQANTLKGFGISLENQSIAYLQESLKARKTITVYRWLCDGLKLIHTELCGGVGIRPIPSERGKTQLAMKIAGNDILQDGQMHGVSAGSSELSTSPIGTSAILIYPETPPPDEFQSPLLDAYWKNPDVKKACYRLSQEGQTCTPLAIARTILNQKLDLTNLDGNQKILATELLAELVYENALPAKWGKRMPRLNVEKNWLHSHTDNLSPILKALIEADLIAVDEVNIKIGNRLIHDYLIGRINTEAGANPLPPGGSDCSLSTWLYWLLVNLIDKNELGLAGAVAWAIQGGQVGFSSQTWHQLQPILDLLPETAFSNYSLWTARSIINAIDYERTADPKSSCTVPLDDHQVDRSDRRAESLIFYARNYEANLKIYLNLSHNSGMTEKGFSIFIISNMGDLPPEYRDYGHVLLLHSLSQIQFLSRGNDLTSKRKLHFNKHEGHIYIDELSIRDIILHEAKRIKPVYLNWFAEPLAAWGCTEIVKYIKKKKTGNSFIDARGEILIRAVEGNDDYQSWI